MKKFLYIFLFYTANSFAESIVSADKNQHVNDTVTGNLKNYNNLNEVSNSEKFPRPLPSMSMRSFSNITFSGNVVSQLWYQNEYSTSYNNYDGTHTDAIMKVKITNKNNDLAISYGADIQIKVPLVKGYINSQNKGMQLFVNGGYGNFSIGYHNGAEVYMKVNNIQAGHPIDPINLTIDQRNTNTPYYISPVLYNENIANLTDINVRNSDEIKNQINQSLPMRLSFITPSFMGLKLGMSYTPTGYNNTMLMKDSIQRMNNLDSSNEDFKVSNYTNIVSGGLSYNYHGDNAIIKYSITGEYAKAEEHLNFHSYNYYYELHDLMSSAVGLNIEWPSGIKLAGSYGYLGKSGLIKEIYTNNDNNYLTDKKIHNPDNINTQNYYFSYTMGYQYKDSYFSINYMKSDFQNYIFDNIGIGGEYNLNLKKNHNNQCKIFANYNYFSTKNKNNDNKHGSIATGGIKLTF